LVLDVKLYCEVIVALANGDVRIYKEKYLINSFRMDVSVLSIGRVGIDYIITHDYINT
jgi:hypothetical protein